MTALLSQVKPCRRWDSAPKNLHVHLDVLRLCLRMFQHLGYRLARDFSATDILLQSGNILSVSVEPGHNLERLRRKPGPLQLLNGRGFYLSYNHSSKFFNEK